MGQFGAELAGGQLNFFGQWFESIVYSFPKRFPGYVDMGHPPPLDSFLVQVHLKYAVDEKGLALLKGTILRMW